MRMNKRIQLNFCTRQRFTLYRWCDIFCLSHHCIIFYLKDNKVISVYNINFLRLNNSDFWRSYILIVRSSNYRFMTAKVFCPYIDSDKAIREFRNINILTEGNSYPVIIF